MLQDFGWGVRGWAQLLSLLLSDWRGDGQATVAVGRIRCYRRALSFTASPTMSEPLLIRVAVELGSYQHTISLEKTLTIYSNVSGENLGPLSPPQGCLNASRLFVGPQLLLPSPAEFLLLLWVSFNTLTQHPVSAIAAAAEFLLHFVCHPRCAHICCSSLLLRGSCYSPFHDLEGH